MVVEDRGVQHLLGSAAALGLGVVAPCVLPGALLAGAAGAIGGVAGNLLANVLQKHLDKREKDPTLPDINHDLLRVIADGVAHEIAEFARENADALGEQRRLVEKLAKNAAMAYTALFVSSRLPGVTIPDPLMLLEASARDGEISKVGEVSEWEAVVRQLCSQAGVGLDAEVEVQLARWLHEHVWEAIRKALKRDFAHDGRGYAALHLNFMGELMARVDALAQQPREQQEAMQLTRELIEALKAQNQRGARPKGEAIIQKLSEGDRTRLGRLTQRFEQLSASIDRHFEELLHEVREADRGSRRRDTVTHERLAWTLCGIAIVGMIVTGTFWLLRVGQKDQVVASDGIARNTDLIGRSVGDVGQRIGQMDEKVDRLVTNLLKKAPGSTQQVEVLRAQLEEMVQSLAKAGAAGDAQATKSLTEMEGGNNKVVEDWLDDQIAERQQAVNFLLNQRTALDLLNMKRNDSGPEQENQLARMEQRLDDVLKNSPNDFDANNLKGVVHIYRNDAEAARRQFEKVRTLAGADLERQATALRNLAAVELMSGNVKQAAWLMSETVALHRRSGDVYAQADALDDLGRIEHSLEEYADAEKHLTEAVGIFRNLKMPLMESESMSNLAATKRSLNLDQEAEDLYLRAYDIEVTSGSLVYQAGALVSLASVNLTQGDLDAAEGYVRKALEVNRQLGDKFYQARDLEQLGHIAQKRKQWDEALGYYGEAVSLFKGENAIEDVLYATRSMADVEVARANFDAAAQHVLAALKNAVDLNRLDLQGDVLSHLIEIEKLRGNLAAAAQLEVQLNALDDKLLQLEQARGAANRGFAAMRAGNLTGASRDWNEARLLFLQLEMDEQAGRLQEWIDWAGQEMRSAI